MLEDSWHFYCIILSIQNIDKANKSAKSLKKEGIIVRYLVCCIIAVTLLCGPDKATAVPLLDQAFDGPDFGVGSNNPMAQTFTVGTGGILTSVGLEVGFGPANIAVDILSTSSGAPVSASPLASISVPNPNAFYSFTNFDFSLFNISVNAGDVLAIGVRSLDPSWAVNWNSSAAIQGVPMYSAGAAWRLIGPTWVTVESTFPNYGEQDFHFQTFVEPASVPEPSTLLLLGSGLIGFVGLRRKFKG